MKSILCIEDDLVMQTLVVESLKNYQVTVTDTLKEACDILDKERFDAILLDIQLKDEDGLRVLEKVSKKDGFFQNTALFIMSSHKDISKKMMAFSLGADDFISKPFDPLELQIRLDARLKKIASPTEIKHIGDLIVDLQKQKVFIVKDNVKKDINLTAIELKIFNYLTSQMDRVFSREQIIHEVWDNLSITERTVDSHIGHLRKKIADSKLSIITSNNFGYFASLKV